MDLASSACIHVARHRACMLASSRHRAFRQLARLSGTGCCSNRLAVYSSKTEYSSKRLVVSSNRRQHGCLLTAKSSRPLV